VRRICAWCGRDLGATGSSDNPEGETASIDTPTGRLGAGQRSDDPGVTSTICSGCATALAAYRKPVLVVSQKWARMYEELVELLRDRPDIQVVLDRRQPAEVGDDGGGWDGAERRRDRHPLVLE